MSRFPNKNLFLATNRKEKQRSVKTHALIDQLALDRELT